MTLSTSSLIEAAYEGAGEQPPWRSFLAMLRHEVAADYAGLTFAPAHRPPGQPVEIYAGIDPPAGLRATYREGGYRRDPLRDLRLEEGRVYTLAELLDPGDAAHRTFFEEVLRPRGMHYLRVLQVTESGGTRARLSVARAQRDFAPEDAALLAGLHPHVRRALHSHLAIDRARFAADTASVALSRLDFGWISLAADLVILEASPHAERLLALSPALARGADGRLRCAARVAAALRDVAAGRHERPHAVHVSDEPWIDLLAVPAAEGGSGASRPAAIAYIHGDRRSAADRHDQIAELFGLTPSEARLALAISRGRSLAEAAADLGLATTTARTYSKAIYAKVGARGQADLVRLILASVLALA